MTDKDGRLLLAVPRVILHPSAQPSTQTALPAAESESSNQASSSPHGGMGMCGVSAGSCCLTVPSPQPRLASLCVTNDLESQ